YGTPLQDTSEQVKITDNIDAILISHPHQDHLVLILQKLKSLTIMSLNQLVSFFIKSRSQVMLPS
ncbi:MAG: hypothetical protein U9N49_00085, partial [Campylobacterota bacterium]|nr:hypothetical protein [Campylobacterota bacterium]